MKTGRNIQLVTRAVKTCIDENETVIIGTRNQENAENLADLIDWLGECDYVIHEANLGIHTPVERLESLPESFCSRLGLIHYTDALEPGDTSLHLLQQGEVIEIAAASARRSA